MTMVRPFAPADLDWVMEIWLAANLQAHCFVPAEYWTGNAPQVRRQLPQAELHVYEAGGAVQGFAGLRGIIWPASLWTVPPAAGASAGSCWTDARRCTLC